ncbi:MAG: hypothetical protein JNM63_06520 [Spirochaetia bacterium]|nr:hypothetical protein [Spirochaetia bacterium]
MKQWREEGVPSVEIARRLVRSLASVQSVFRKFIYLEELRFPIEKSVMSEKILYEMARKRREQPGRAVSDQPGVPRSASENETSSESPVGIGSLDLAGGAPH